MKITRFCLLILLNFLLACHDESGNKEQKKTDSPQEPPQAQTFTSQQLRQGIMKLPSGEKVEITLALSQEEQTIGLSGTKDNEWGNDQGMLFFYADDDYRRFWMPNTYFNLDIYFLDKDLTVLDIHRNLAHFVDSGPYHLVPQSKTVYCRHVLEIKSASPLAKKIKPGDKLTWESSPSLWQIELNTRHLR